MTEPINNAGVDTVEPLPKVDSVQDAGTDTVEPLPKVDSVQDAGTDTAKPLHKVEFVQDAGTETVVPLSKVDSAVQGLSSSPPKDKTDKAASRRKSSMVAGVGSIRELKESETPIEVAKETQGTGWKINTSPTTVDEKDILTKLLVTPAIRAIELHFKHGLVVHARNKNGVTIKDALDAIHHKYKKRSDDELGDEPYLAGFEWLPIHPNYQGDDEDSKQKRLDEWDRLHVHLAPNSTAKFQGGGKKKNKKAE